MNRRILLHEDATIALNEYFTYISQGNHDRALQFFDAARQTFATLAQMPGMGRLYDPEEEGIADLRKWAVKGFNNYLIFYRYDDETLEVLRIIYATRDLGPLLKDLQATIAFSTHDQPTICEFIKSSRFYDRISFLPRFICGLCSCFLGGIV